jgi:hypothetical protein
MVKVKSWTDFNQAAYGGGFINTLLAEGGSKAGNLEYIR